jgi:hypothetical protein
MANRNRIYTHMTMISVMLLLFAPLSAYATKTVAGVNIDPSYHAWENLLDF